MTIEFTSQSAVINGPGVHIGSVELQHNLPFDNDFFIVQFARGLNAPESVVVVRDSLKFPLSMIDQSASYKLLAFKISNGIADGVWWVDNYVYDENQVNIEFKSSAENSGTGKPNSFSGTVLVSDQPAARNVVALALDGETPYQLARTVSDPSTGAYTLNWNGYAGQVLITVHDDYGVPHVTGEARGVGERIHPSIYTGYVYDVTITGTLGAEPVWPTSEGETVFSGDCQLIAVPFYRPVSEGPFFV
jgi:hypothetical protein